MRQAFSSLERVIDLETKQGFQDKAVVGGIRQFATYWASQAREETDDEADLALIDQVADTLVEYSQLPGIEARAAKIDMLKSKLKIRQERNADAGQETTAAEKQPPKAKTRQPVKQEPPEVFEEEIGEPVTPDPEGLRQPTTTVKGVGVKSAEQLSALGADSIGDLLYLFPRRYDDYSLLKPINRLAYGEQVTVIGTIWETRVRQGRNLKYVQSVITDGTGKIQATWFNQPWMADKLKAGMQIVLSGTVDQFLGRPVFQNPEWEPLEVEPLKTRRIVPVYGLTKGLTARKMREIMKRVTGEWAPRVPDPVPPSICSRRNYISLQNALKQIHFPDNSDALHRARQRLVFDELFLLQLGMLGHRRDWQASPGLPIPYDRPTLNKFISQLPFELTQAQERVIGEIAADMANPVPMNRLLQGDVGSGKTVVAAAAMILAAHAGTQSALMAPTEILAEQHFKGLNEMLTSFGFSVVLLTGSTPTAERQALYAGLADGTIQIAIGTHALIQESVQFHRLGLAIIDEQHRFGVDQRKALRDKGAALPGSSEQPNPHLLVMSATPIPRSLALSLYGDLDLSIVDEMPPGRQEIKTYWLRSSERERAYSFVRSQIAEGRQAFVIYPLVEESEKIEAKAATEEYQRLQEEIFPDLKLGLLHGRMKSAEKEAAMRDFYNGNTHILVATSVIEVGIDVPNSTIMLIEGANRFGLAQLHQFRGRVGRGEHQSYCLLLADAVTGDVDERLSALEKSNDGFLLAEKDLEIRGPGEFLGRRQSGIPELRLASLSDIGVLQIARKEAQSIFKSDPYLEQPEHQRLQELVGELWQQAGDVS